MDLKLFEFNGLWRTSLNGDLSNHIKISDAILVIYYYMITDEKILAQRGLNNLRNLLYKYPNRPPAIFNGNLEPIKTVGLLTGDDINIQNDLLGQVIWLYSKAFLYKYQLGKKWDTIVEKILFILSEDQYWDQKDYGMWGDVLDIHTSSIGICLSGLTEFNSVRGDNHLEILIKRGMDALSKNKVFGETSDKLYDSSLLNLIWPFRILPNDIAYHFLDMYFDTHKGNCGMIRFTNDPYYRQDGVDAEWPQFLFQLLLSVHSLGLWNQYESYSGWKAIKTVIDMEYPECLFGIKKLKTLNSPYLMTVLMYLFSQYLLSKNLVEAH